MNFDQFYILFNDTATNFDGVSGSQCESLVNFYSRAIGGPRFTGDFAYMIFDQAGDFYDQILNTPEGIPQKGDIVVWEGAFNGGAGHTAIANGVGDVNSFEAFSENDPIGARAHIQHYDDYNHVLGWLHPKQIVEAENTTPLITQEELDQVRADRDSNWNLFSEVSKNLGVEPNPEDKQTSLNQALEAIAVLKNSIPTPSDSQPEVGAENPTETIAHKFPTLKKLVEEFMGLLHHEL